MHQCYSNSLGTSMKNALVANNLRQINAHLGHYTQCPTSFCWPTCDLCLLTIAAAVFNRGGIIRQILANNSSRSEFDIEGFDPAEIQEVGVLQYR